MKFHMLCLAFVLLSPDAESAITSWSNPTTITSAASGTGTLTVSESQALSTAITTYAAETGATNKTITYKLEPAAPPFALSQGGILTITAKLDARATSSYTLNIVATDAATQPGTGTATITVTVTAIPKFGSPSYTKCILDDSAIDTTLITVLATDIDTGDTVTHSIASGNSNTDFKIDPTSGVIQVAKALSSSTYTLVVKAVDSESPAKTGSTTVTVTVADDCSEKNSAAMNVISVTSLIICILTMLQ